MRTANNARIIAACIAIMACVAVRPAASQVRGFGAGALVLDDNHGHRLVIQTPQPGDPGYAPWITGGQLTLSLPIPPASGANMGFIYPGPQIAGPAQMLLWDPPNSAGGTGGAQGAWRPESITDALGSAGLLTGSGDSGRIAGYYGPDSLGNADLTGDVTTSGGLATRISDTGAAGVAAGSHIVSAINSDPSTGAVNATNGGTGNSTYSTGDILVASSPTALTRLPVGSTGQVLGVSAGGSPEWVANSVNVTYTMDSAAIDVTQNDFAVDNGSSYFRFSNTSGGSLNITGISSAGISDGRVITIVNVSASPSEVIVLQNLNSGSASADQFDLPGGADILLSPKGAATLIYDATLSKWELVSTN